VGATSKAGRDQQSPHQQIIRDRDRSDTVEAASRQALAVDIIAAS